MAGGGGGYQPDQYATNIQAGIARDRYNDWLKRYAPLEADVTRSLSDPAAREADMNQSLTRAGESVDQQFDVAQESLGREMRRYNATPTPDETASINRRMNLGRAATKINALNRTRAAATDRTDQAMRDVIATGRGVSSQADQAAGTSAGMETNRNATNAQLEAARQSRVYNNAATMAGAGMAIFALSSRKAKKSIKPATSKDAAKALNDTKVKSFEYKPSMGVPKGKKLGPIAEEAPEAFQGPSGKTVNLANMVGALVKGHQDMAKRVKRLEKRA